MCNTSNVIPLIRVLCSFVMNLAGTVYIGPTTEFWQQANSWESVCVCLCVRTICIAAGKLSVSPSLESDLVVVLYWLNVCTVMPIN